MDIRVLGTRFYVSSYGRDRTQEVVLRSGSVNVAPADAPEHGIRIEPDQRASLDTAGTFRIREVRAEDYISWIHRDRIFELLFPRLRSLKHPTAR